MDRIPLHAIDKPSPLTTCVQDVADLIVAYLEQLQIEYVFGVPGGAIEPLYNALARSERRGGPRPITARHEAGAAFMADGYARETGKIGVCIATSGPGATNLITGIACAYDNSIPVLAITGQPPLPSFGRRALQESGCTGVNVVGMFRHCTRYNSLVSHGSQAETKIVGALMRASQTMGPAHLSIPVDVQRANPGQFSPAYSVSNLLTKPTLVDEFSLHELNRELSRAKTPVFLIGAGCASAAAYIVALAEKLDAPFISTPDGKGFINPQHPLYQGVFGFAGHERARALLESDPDLIVVVGASLGEWASGGWSDCIMNERMIHVDASEDNLMRSPMARLHVRGHVPTVFRRLIASLPSRMAPQMRYAASAVPVEEATTDTGSHRITPQALMRQLSLRCPPTARFFADTGNSTAWAVHCLNLKDRRLSTPPLDFLPQEGEESERRSPARSWLRVTMDFAPMGWAIGASIGAAFADSRYPTICLTGDGSYLMNGQEITVAQSAGLPVVFVILNDGALGMVMHGQRLAKAEQVGFQLPEVNFAGIAEALGIPALIIETPEDMARIDFKAIFERRGPTLLDVRIDPEQVPPMAVRMKVLEGAK